eukprot:scaffold24242_cov66-Phaeocystis_antarctica.AAC.1
MARILLTIRSENGADQAAGQHALPSRRPWAESQPRGGGGLLVIPGRLVPTRTGSSLLRAMSNLHEARGLHIKVPHIKVLSYASDRKCVS